MQHARHLRPGLKPAGHLKRRALVLSHAHLGRTQAAQHHEGIVAPYADAHLPDGLPQRQPVFFAHHGRAHQQVGMPAPILGER